jgi:hypothetical protein
MMCDKVSQAVRNLPQDIDSPTCCVEGRCHGGAIISDDGSKVILETH